MEQPGSEVLPIKQGLILDLLDQQHPALSANSDMPVIETKPDATPEKEAEAAPPAPEEDEGEAELSDESATSATDEQPGVPPKKSRGVQKKLDELTKQREEAERRVETERAEKERLLALLERQSEPKPEVVPEVDLAEPVRPVRADYADDNAFMDAVSEYVDKKADYVTAKRQAEAEKAQAEARIAQQVEEAQRAFAERTTKAKEKYADFSEVAERPDVAVSMPVAHALMRLETGTDLQYYLGKNADEAKKISSYVVKDASGKEAPDVLRQIYELGRISAKLEAPAEPKPKPISNAPKPLVATKPGETVVVKDPSTMTMDEYKKWRGVS